MKKNYFISSAIMLSLVLLAVTNTTQAQNIGINATGAAPDGGAMLDISSANKGLLVPRVNIISLATIAPITGSTTTSMLVYNTNATTGLGYHYWDGAKWVRFFTGDAWELTGNAGTNATTNFLGTTDNNALRIRTNNANRFEFTTNGRLRSFDFGSASEPTYSFTSDTDIGMYRYATNTLGFSTSGTERMRIIANGNIGIGGVNPSQKLHVSGGNFRLDGAFMPNNIPGTTGQALLSAGAGVAPTWGVDLSFLNEISRWYYPPININANTGNRCTTP